MLKRLVGWLTAGAGLLVSPLAHGQEQWTHYGLRPLAMGNAFVSVVDDFNTLFYNPAGLARLKSWDGEFLNPYLEYSANTKAFVEDATALQNDSGDATKGALELIQKNTGKSQHGALGFVPHLIFKHFGFGLSMEIDGTMTFHRYPSVDLNFGPRIILPIAMAFNFLDDRLSVGMGVKVRARGGVNHEFSIQDIEALKNKNDDSDSKSLEDFVEGGYGIGSDIGILFTPVKTMEPTLGVSITDFGGTTYKKMDIGGTALGTPDIALPSVNAGVSFKPIQTNRTYVLASADMHSINQPYSFSKKFNLGMELGLGSLFKVQAGLHQGYLTGGFQFDVGLLNLRAVTYSEELGSTAGSVEDRRYALQLKLLI